MLNFWHDAVTIVAVIAGWQLSLDAEMALRDASMPSQVRSNVR